MTQQLLDPRTAQLFPGEHPLAGAIDALVRSSATGDTARATTMLTSAIRRLLMRGDGALVMSALGSIAPGVPAQRFVAALDDAINIDDDTGELLLIARLFLMPVLFITAGKSPATVSGIVPAVDELHQVLKESGALGPIENFGLGNALGSHTTVSAIDAGRVFQATRALVGEGTALDLWAPEPVSVTTAAEQVHLRYLTGAAVSAANAPTFLETAGTVGRWGMRASQALIRQLAEPGLQLLALPRAPMRWFSALAEGSYALEEVTFSLFLSAALRELRASTGEPEITISTSGQAVRVDLASQFDDMQRYSHAWRLNAADTIERVEASIVGLLQDCRAERITFR